MTQGPFVSRPGAAARRRFKHRRATIALAAVAVLGLAACGGAGSGAAAGSSSNGGTPQKGGTLNMLGSGDVDYMDPNITYYSIGNLAAREGSC